MFVTDDFVGLRSRTKSFLFQPVYITESQKKHNTMTNENTESHIIERETTTTL